jgi:hypothetical protein
MRRPESFFPPERFGAVKAVVRVSAGLSAAGSYMVSTDAGEFFLRHFSVVRQTLPNQIRTAVMPDKGR